MAGYNELRGLRVKYLSADPANPEDGQVWYNSTTGNLRVQGIGVGAWSSAAPMISAKKAAMPGGIQTAAFTAGGNDGPANVNSTFEYNGSGFSTGGNINTTRRGGGGAGTLTAGLILGGFSTTIVGSTEEYDGTSWTSVNSMGTGRSGTGSNGLQTAAFAIGGYDGTSQTNLTEEYDGTSWSTGNTCPTSAGERAADGIQTAAIVFGGTTSTGPGTQTANAELYDGTNFTSASPLNTARERVSGFGTQSNAYAFGGDVPPSTTKTENYNGTSWTETSDMATARKENQSGQTGSPTAGIAMGGNTAPGSAISATEEFNFGTTTITAAAWSSGDNLNTARARAGGMLGSDSTQNASMAFGGQDPGGVVNLTEEYNGAGWSAGGTLNTARRWHYGAGSQTAALCAGGVASAGATPVTANSEEYDGSSWTAGNSMGTGRYSGGSGGTQTAAFATGGSPAPTYTNATEEYDGSSWTAGGNLPVSAGYFGGGGTLTAGIVMGIGPSATNSYEYDGSSWASSVTMNRGGSQSSYAGLQTDGIAFGGSPTTLTEGYDGTAWSTRPSMGTARYALAGSSGTSTSALGCGGEVTPQTNATEEFTGETVSANPASNLSVS